MPRNNIKHEGLSLVRNAPGSKILRCMCGKMTEAQVFMFGHRCKPEDVQKRWEQQQREQELKEVKDVQKR